MTVAQESGTRVPVVSVSDEHTALTDVVARALVATARHGVNHPSWVDAARAGWSDLPAGVRRPLHEFRRDSGRSGALLLRGLPVDGPALPPTPTTYGSVQQEASVPAAVLTLVACGLGDPTAFLAEKGGALVQDVVPVPGKEEFQGNAGSVLLTFHNENAFHPFRPDYVMLLCLRPDHDGAAGLRTASIRDALPLVGPQGREALSAPEFRTDPPPSFGAAGGGDTRPHAVVHGSPEDPDLCVDLSATRALTPRAADALAELRDAFEWTAQSTVLVPGDLAIVDNRITTHGRTAFRPRYDGRDRWLQRTFVTTDLRRSRALRPGDGYVLV